MGLAAGTRLGPYEIQAALGAGGMGEVYRARDTRLDRTVAIKILPETLAADPQFRERFDREARAISSLNHAHICTLHDVGRQGDIDFLVMEYLEGETLEDRIRRLQSLRLPGDGGGLRLPGDGGGLRLPGDGGGVRPPGDGGGVRPPGDDGGLRLPGDGGGVRLPGEGSGRPSGLPMQEALQIAIQVADALATAHRAGVIHRDLKPGNIFLVGKRGSSGDVRRGTPSGAPTAKLLDFGLAKASAPAVAGAGQSMLPTTPPTLTGQGTILGTFQYMAPEQLEGDEADVRTDIFAFGAVVYEMLAGKRAFEGKSHASLIGAIMHAEPPPLSSIQPLVPRSLDRVVRKCLAKNPDHRWQTAQDLLDELKWITETGEQAITAAPSDAAAGVSVATVPRRAMWRRMALAGVALILTAGLATSVTWLLTRASPVRVSRLTVTTGGNAVLSIDGTVRDLAITPDGTRVVYVGANGTAILVRRLDALEPVTIFKGAPRMPFISPDGQWVGFFDANIVLKRVAMTGGPAITIRQLDGNPRGATWLSDDTIVFATLNPSTGLQRVAARGGSSAVVTRPNGEQGEQDHLWPEALPGGRAVLFTISARTGGPDAAQVAAARTRDGSDQGPRAWGQSRALCVERPPVVRRRRHIAGGGFRPRAVGGARNPGAGRLRRYNDRPGRCGRRRGG